MTEIIVSAPGKIILHGEHSVVYGRSAIACSLNIRTYLKLSQTKDERVSLVFPDIDLTQSWSLEEVNSIQLPQGCENLNPKPPTEDVVKQLKTIAGSGETEIGNTASIVFLYIYLYLCKNRKQGIELKVKSELPIGAGLGSSAGFSVCLSAAFLILTGNVSTPGSDNIWKSDDLELINRWAFIGETLNHGTPSGIDNSIATYGKAIKLKSGTVHKLDKIPNLRILLINTKIPRCTKDLVAGVRRKYEMYEDIVTPVLNSMEAIVSRCEAVFSDMTGNHGDVTSCYKKLKDLIDMNHDLLRFLGVSHPSLEIICKTCQQYGLHCKLTGAGGGGCAFCLISPETTEETLQTIETELKKQNFECWETSVGGNGVMCHDPACGTISSIPDFLKTT